EIQCFTGEQRIDASHPVSCELLGEPVCGGSEAALDPPRRELEDRPAVPAVMHEGLEHVPAPPAVEWLEREDIQLARHRGLARGIFRTLSCHGKGWRVLLLDAAPLLCVFRESAEELVVDL